MHVPCPSCGINLSVPETSVGKNVKCSSCAHVFLVPAPEEQTVLPGDSALTSSPPPRPAPRGDAGARSDRGRPRGPVTPPPPSPTTKKSGLGTPLIIGGIAGGVLLLCCGGCGLVGLIMSFTTPSSTTTKAVVVTKSEGLKGFPGAPQPMIPVAPPAANASLTFAEFVDRDTLEPRGVRDSFPPGEVHMIIRGAKAFDDIKIMVYFSKEGSIAEQVLGDYTIDPKWNLYTAKISLNLPGIYIIKAKTTRGDLIAEGRLTVR